MQVEKLIPVKNRNLAEYDTSYLLNYVSRVPLYVHATGTIICLGLSAYYHNFYIMSEFWNRFLAKLDYAGICIQIFGSSVAPIMYIFAC